MMKLSKEAGLDSAVFALIQNTERISKTIESMPDLININRDIVLNDIDRQRSESLDLLIAERKAIIREIRQERVEVINQLISERKAVIDEMINHSNVVLDQIDSIGRETIEFNFDRMEKTVDKIIFHAYMLLGLAFVGLLIIFIVHKKL